jgi:hypothetical protein
MNRLDALAKDYGKKIQITDGGRTYAQQVDVRRRKPNLAAKPGNSNHEIGTAADIASQWVRNLSNAQLKKYGLYKSALSKGETWHVDLIENDGRSNRDTVAYLGGVKPKSGGSAGGGYLRPSGSLSSSSRSSGGRGSGVAYRQVPSSISGIVDQAAQKYKVNPNLIAAIIKKESTFKNNLRSGAGAMGYMQLMPGTARDLGVRNAMDPTQNIMGGTKYIRQMLENYGGNVELALAAYNWGAGNLNKARRRYGSSWSSIRSHAPKETRDYVDKIMGWR